MELLQSGSEKARAASVTLFGRDDFDLIAGKTLKIETSPRGSEFLVATVPAGKAWRVQVAVSIVETDA